MKQEAFEKQNRESWEQLEAWIEELGNRRKADAGQRREIGREFPKLYRRICHHLALARARRYSAGLQQRLNQLALDGHQHMYRSGLPFLAATARFFANDFPAAFRTRWRYVLLSHAVFYLPALCMALALVFRPELIYSLLDPFTVGSMESMYDPANDRLGRERQSDTDLMMFGYYIYNNISIGFQIFAGGLLFGVGSLFYLVFNGLYFGAVATHLTAAGFSSTFWTFVIGHGALELTAITIFGAAGLMLSHRAIAPGRKRRWHAIRDAARESLPLVYGGTAMLLLAAFVEAFWSSTSWPPAWIKYSVGAVLWCLTYGYLLLLGRRES
ncbi:MAG: stage II sporulation protein M [Pseudomonadota bacterium]